MGDDIVSSVGSFVTSAQGASLLGGLLQSAGSIYTNQRSSSQAQQQIKQNQALYSKYANQTPEQVMAGIMALKQPLTAAMKQRIVQDVTSQIASRGGSGDPGIIQEAIDNAMAQAESQLFQQAEQAYFASQQLPIQARPPAVTPSAGVGNPFDALAKYYTKAASTTPPPGGSPGLFGQPGTGGTPPAPPGAAPDASSGGDSGATGTGTGF